MITRQLLFCLGVSVALGPIGAQVYAETGACPVGPVPPPRAAPPAPTAPAAPVGAPRPRPAPRGERPGPGPLAPPARPRAAVAAARPRPGPRAVPARAADASVPRPAAARGHRFGRPYHPSATGHLAPAGFSTVTLMLLVTTPAVLAAAILRPRSRSGARPCRNG
ncbi:hypothetical protein AB0M57_03340 [Streptomyces sp. NPDC051597]|uniref:hypothetical protein n=1 Tax=Streptomyces sp. NPDC051597 TaxID=3155049 RepID=UPI00343750EC